MNEQLQQQQPQSPPPNYLVFSILTTIFCCQVLGIVSIVFAAQVNSRWASGDYQGAQSASNNARLWAIIALISGIVVGFGFFLLAFFGALTSFGLSGLNF